MFKKGFFLFFLFLLLCINISFAFEKTWDFSVQSDYTLSNVNDLEFSGNSVVLKQNLTAVHTGAIVDDAVTLLNAPEAVFVSGNYAYVINYFSSPGLEILDILDPKNPIHAGSILDNVTTLLNFPKDIVVSGNYAYITSIYEDGLEIVDISDPTNPTHAGSLVDNGTTALDNASSIVISGNYAYIVSQSDHGLEIVDISDPTNPTHAGSITKASNPTALLTGAGGIAVQGNYAYIVGRNWGANPGLEVVDISDPTNPTHAGLLVDDSTTLLSFSEDIVVSGNYAYIANDGSNASDPGLEIVDISDPTNPTHAGSLADDGVTALRWASSIVISGNYVYITSRYDNGLEIVDVSDPTNPTHVSSTVDDSTLLLDGAEGLFVQGDYVYVAGKDDHGIEVLSLANRYSTNKPYVTINSSLSYKALTGFYGISSNGSLGNIKYQISLNNGFQWKWKSGIASPWSLTSMTDGTETTTLADLTGGLSLLGYGNFKWRAYLESDGLQQVQLNEIKILYEQNNPITDVKIDGMDSDNIDGDSATGTVVGVLTSIDADSADVHTYSLCSDPGDIHDNSKFSISGDQLVIEFMPDYSLPIDVGDTAGNNTYVAQVCSDDQMGSDMLKIFVITINNPTGGSTSGGGGGSSISRDVCPDGDTSSSYYDGTCGFSNIGEEINDNVKCDFDDEFKNGYCFAKKNSITTIEGFENADPDGTILRKHLAKMMVNFKKNVLGDLVSTDIVDSCSKYNDLGSVSNEFKGYIYIACSMGIMGVDSISNLPQNKFNPDGVVSRAEFGTVLSRVLWGAKYNVSQGNRYTKHLGALKNNGYVKYIDGNWPMSKEVRKYVWLMLQRVGEDN